MIIIKKEFFRENDREEIQKILDFCSNLVILDKVKAQSLETSETVYAASDYIAAYYNLAEYDEETRAKIILNYEEKNPYYKTLQLNYGIEPGFSRESKHLSILKATSSTLSRFEEELFYDCYYESLSYFDQVISTNAFNFHQNYSNFIMTFLIWGSIQKYLTRKMDTLFNIDFYDEKMLKNSFISLGLDYFDGLPINYQRKLLKKINDIISNKGSTQCFIDIMEVFGDDSVNISNYYLVKKYNKVIDKDGKEVYNPILEFYKTPFTQELDMNSDEYFDFEEIVINDKYWKASKEEILNKEFNTVRTNYISINSAMDITKNSLQFSYFFNFLEKAIANNKLTNSEIINTKISPSPFNLFNALITLMTLGMKINGYKDNIIKNSDVSNYVFGYANDNSNYANVQELVSNIKLEIAIDTQMDDNDKLVLNSFVNRFDIDKLQENKYSLKEFLEIFYSNEETRNTLDSFIQTTTNYKIVKNLQRIKDIEMRTIVNNNLFKNYKTYSEYLQYNDINLYNFTIFDDTYKSEADLYINMKQRMNELISSINAQLYNEKLGDAISRNTFFGINNYLEYYIKTLVLLFKPYSLELLNPSDFLDLKDRSENVRLYDSFEKHLIKTEVEYIGLNEKLEIINKEGVQIL